MLIFKFHPLFNAFYMSFHGWDLLNPPTWIGLDNYVRLFNDARFHNSLSVSLRYALSTTACLTVLGLGLGLMFNKATAVSRFCASLFRAFHHVNGCYCHHLALYFSPILWAADVFH